ncbi:uncharacterized protein TM35_000221900 [Trypanosoma theileri]|uniref:Transmembrane protein n=1 Tax=Trypanosoma theileri TaxID=67003 RepID=A0A1X0NS15_9TRYP|nr:uncharacterized protein TM35_000221900 [Trypanosoma theileri]ORC87391.1 hypothetical protein TM35_000221900 [Trypanosoma theileri]
MESFPKEEKRLTTKEKYGRVLSYAAFVTVSCIVCFSLFNVSDDVLPELFSGFWTTSLLPEYEGINLTCSYGSKGRCTAFIRVSDTVVDNLSMKFVSSQAAGWVAVEPIAEDGWIVLRSSKGQLILRILSLSGVKTFSLDRRLTDKKSTSLWGKKWKQVCAIFIVVGLFKWFQLKYFSHGLINQRRRRYRERFIKTDIMKKRN